MLAGLLQSTSISLLRNFTFSTRIYYLILITSHANTTYSCLYRRKCLQLSKYPVLNDSLGFVVTFFVEQRRESSRRKTANEQRNIGKNHSNVFRHRKIRSRRSVFLCCETNFIIFSKVSSHHATSYMNRYTSSKNISNVPLGIIFVTRMSNVA